MSMLLDYQREHPFIDIYRLEDANDTIFGNYQRYDFYQVIWFESVKGDNSYFLDFNEYKIQDNQIIVVFPGQIDKLDPEGKEGYLFAIHSDIFFNIGQHIDSDYLHGYFSNVFVSPDNEVKKILDQLVALLLREYTSLNRIKLMESYLEAFLFHVSALFERTETFRNKGEFIVSELMRLIDHNFIVQRETDFYADQLNMSNKKINEISKRGTGKTVKQHLQERLILEIKKEIRLREKSLKEIAFDLGFNEPAYFTRFFKQHTAMTPKEFKVIAN
ncbi:helix-turn-helix domain-containing protein [Dysgonomonas sp. OttesenSCG-928-M03]|nr:helix-turn-helix domain-containing protein [Dysgonomonas sp. OttesenSCG-928-M03]